MSNKVKAALILAAIILLMVLTAKIDIVAMVVFSVLSAVAIAGGLYFVWSFIVSILDNYEEN